MADILKLTKLTYVVVFGASIINFAAGLLEPTIAPYLEVLGASSAEIGFIISARFLVVALTSLPLALFASRISLRLFLYISGLVAILGGFLLALIPGVNGVYFFYLTIGLAGAIYNGPGAALIAENTGSKRITAFSLFFATWMIPPALGAGLSAIWFRDVTDYNPAILASIFPISSWTLILGGAGFIVLMVFMRGATTSSELSAQVPIMTQFKRLFAPIIVVPLLLLFFVEFLSGAGAGATLPFLTPYLKSLGATPTELSVLVFILNILLGVATQLSGPLAKKFGDLKVWGVTSILSVLCLLGIVFSNTLIIAATFYILRGIFANMNAPISSSRLLTYIDSRVRATGSAASSTCRWVGWTLSSPISGGIIDNYGYNTSFIFTSVIYLVTYAIFLSVNLRFRNLEEIIQTEDHS
ncbi:MAG: MFS transporter [Candidatus Hodarchaeota archaeon]